MRQWEKQNGAKANGGPIEFHDRRAGMPYGSLLHHSMRCSPDSAARACIKASDILAEAAYLAGLDVKKAEIHGMSQRGGSVTCDVRFGDEVFSPMVTRGQAEYLVVLETSQVELNRPVLRSGGHLLEPDLLDGKGLHNRRLLNVALLGALSRHLNTPRTAGTRPSTGRFQNIFTR